MPKIALGMSGGIDSSMAVYFLQKAGWEVIGLHLKLAPQQPAFEDQTTADVQAVAKHFGIPLHIIDAQSLFKATIMQPFAESYRIGDTPNPCVRCNKLIKFGHMWTLAQEFGCNYLATGHYAKIDEINGEYGLFRSSDQKKDQSYFLYGIERDRLKHLIFPLGDHNKEALRQQAASLALPIASKKDSQDICFIPDNDYIQWLENNHSLPQHGTFIDSHGQPLGQNNGTWRYTIGQRKGLGLALGYPAYVSAIDAASGTVTVARDEALWHNELKAVDVNWLLGNPPSEGHHLARIRSRDNGSFCTWRFSDHTLYVHFDEPVRAITPGQSIVLYDGDRVLGGGRIC